MSTSLTPYTGTVPSHAETMEIAEVLAQSGAFPTVQKAAQAYAVIIIGQSFGMQPGEALMAISLVQGKPSFDVHWQAKRVMELGHHYEIVQLDGAVCTIRAWRRIDGSLKECGEVTMSMDKAKQIAVYDKAQQGQGKATLGGKWNYRSWAEDMLYAYCMRRVVRRYFPEVLGGYTGEEDATIDAMHDDGVIEGEMMTPERFETIKEELYGDKDEQLDAMRGDQVEMLRTLIIQECEKYKLAVNRRNAWIQANFGVASLGEITDAAILQLILDHVRTWGTQSFRAELAPGDAPAEREPGEEG